MSSAHNPAGSIHDLAHLHLDRAARIAREAELLMAFDLCFAAAAGPDDMALLAADEPAGATRYYASPAMATWAGNLLAQEQATPARRRSAP